MPASSGSYLDAAIEKGIACILLFTPLAFGAVQDWSVALMEIAAFVVLGAWLLKMILEKRAVIIKTPLLLLGGCFFALVMIQLVPLPHELLKIASPATDALYTRVLEHRGSSWRTISVNPDATRDELFKIAAYASVFLVIINHYRTKEQIANIIRLVLAIACFITVFAMVQKMAWNGRMYWFYPVSPLLESNSVNIWGPYISRNHFAGYLEMAMPLGLGLLLYRYSTLKMSTHASFMHLFSRLTSSRQFARIVRLCLLVFLLSAAVFMSLSRGGILGCLASVLFFIILTGRRKSLKQGSRLVAGIVVMMLVIVALASWIRIESRFGEIGKDIGLQRKNVWHDTLTMAGDYPLLGTGLGTFNSIYPRYQTRFGSLLFEHAENDYLELLTDTGAIGFIIAVTLAGVFYRSVLVQWHKRHDPFVTCVGAGGLASCVALHVHGLTDFNFRIPANAMLLAVIAAVIYATVFNVTRERRNDHPLPEAKDILRPQ